MTDERALTSYWPRRSLTKAHPSLSSPFLALSLHVPRDLGFPFSPSRKPTRRDGGVADSTRGESLLADAR